MNRRKILIGSIVVLFVVAGGWVAWNALSLDPTSSDIPESRISDEQRSSISVVAENLDTPWSIATLPDDRLLITERSGVLQILGENGQRFEIADVVEQGEGGLLGLALHPNFADNRQLYIYKTTGPSNVIERYVLEDNQLSQRTSIFTNIPAASNHNGGEIKFGPDKKLYITTGDAGEENLAQDRASLAGKILRVNDDGSIPEDNPFGTAVWSYGHRNPQGIAWDSEDKLWSTEHGPSGLQSGFDELNLIEKGKNYGWPVIRGDENREGMVVPIAHSGGNDTWAPAGLAHHDGSLYFAGLRGQTLYQAKINGNSVDLTRHFTEAYGRLRAVTTQGDDLLVGSSNQDGRGNPESNDDKILRIPLTLLQK